MLGWTPTHLPTRIQPATHACIHIYVHTYICAEAHKSSVLTANSCVKELAGQAPPPHLPPLGSNGGGGVCSWCFSLSTVIIHSHCYMECGSEWGEGFGLSRLVFGAKSGLIWFENTGFEGLKIRDLAFGIGGSGAGLLKLPRSPGVESLRAQRRNFLGCVAPKQPASTFWALGCGFLEGFLNPNP